MTSSTGPLIKPFYPALDGLRAIAVLMVFATHYGSFIGDISLFKWGWVGVDLFFVLSGFLITGILYDTLHKPHFFRNFYVRRALRIFPLFYGFWVALLILSLFVRVEWHRYLVATAFYMGNFFLASSWLGVHPNPFSLPLLTSHLTQTSIELGHLWSLCVEEQFYLLWPLVIWLVRSRRSLLRLCIVVAVLTPLLRWFLYLHLPHVLTINGFLYCSTFTRIDTLLIGSAVALWLRRSGLTLRTIRRTYISLCLVPSTVLALSLLSKFNQSPLPSNLNPIVSTIGFTLIALTAAGILLASIDDDSFLSRALNRRPLIAIGRLSYGIYFIHALPIRAFGGRSTDRLLHHHLYLLPFVAFALTYAAAWLSFRYLESPFLRLKDRLAPHTGHASDPPPATAVHWGSGVGSLGPRPAA